MQVGGHGQDGRTIGDKAAGSVAAGRGTRAGRRFGGDIEKVTLVGCDTGACDMERKVRDALHNKVSTRTSVGYEGQLRVTKGGRRSRQRRAIQTRWAPAA